MFNGLTGIDSAHTGHYLTNLKGMNMTEFDSIASVERMLSTRRLTLVEVGTYDGVWCTASFHFQDKILNSVLTTPTQRIAAKDIVRRQIPRITFEEIA